MIEFSKPLSCQGTNSRYSGGIFTKDFLGRDDVAVRQNAVEQGKNGGFATSLAGTTYLLVVMRSLHRYPRVVNIGQLVNYKDTIFIPIRFNLFICGVKIVQMMILTHLSRRCFSFQLTHDHYGEKYAPLSLSRIQKTWLITPLPSILYSEPLLSSSRLRTVIAGPSFYNDRYLLVEASDLNKRE